MSPTYRIDRARRLVIIAWPTMDPDIGNTRAVVEAMLADLHGDRNFGVLSDWRLATAAASSAYVQGFVELLRSAERQDVTRWATVVASGSEAAYGAGRMTEIRSELQGLVYRVFRDYDEALRWLTEDS